LDHVCAVSGLWWLRQAPGAAFVASAIPVLTLAGMFVFVSRRERAKEKAETLKS
jgi:preprotein translocase subunit YajC